MSLAEMLKRLLKSKQAYGIPLTQWEEWARIERELNDRWKETGKTGMFQAAMLWGPEHDPTARLYDWGGFFVVELRDGTRLVNPASGDERFDTLEAAQEAHSAHAGGDHGSVPAGGH